MEPSSTELGTTGAHPFGALLWWTMLIIVAAVVPASAALVLMGSASFALIIGLITAGGVGLAAVLI